VSRPKAGEPASSKRVNPELPDIASASIPDTLAALHVNRETGLTHAEVDGCRKEHGYNEVVEKTGAPASQYSSGNSGNVGMDARN
jgi:hypothetical protein